MDAAVPSPEASATTLGAGVIAMPSVHGEDAASFERSLRQDLATAGDPTASALELAALLCDQERLAEALEVVQQAQTRSQAPALRVARAGLLRDLGRRHLAVAELQALVREYGAGALHPSLLFELAELDWLEGNQASALADLAAINDIHVGDRWCVEHGKQLAELAAEIQRGSGPERVRVRDLLGNLRGAPNVSTRIRVLEQLAAATKPGDENATGALGARAVAIACADESPVVRARAVQLAHPDAESASEFCRIALGDGAAIVRRFAAARTVELLGRAGAALVLDGLAREEDAATFVVFHDSLGRLGMMPPALPADGVETAAARAEVVAAWRARWPQ